MDIKEIKEHLSTQSYTGPKDIWKLFLSIEGYFGIPNLILAKGTTLYRATVVKNISEINNIKRLSYVPSEYNKTYKRASTPNNTMFYGISGNSQLESILGCFSEVCDCFRIPNPRYKHYNVVVGLWETTKDLVLPQIINVDGRNKSDAFDNTNEFFDSLKIMGDRSLDIIGFWRFMNTEFTKIVDSEKGYWISAIFSEWLVKKMGNNGVIYESVQSKDPKIRNNHCVALTPQIADRYLRFKEALHYEFDFCGDDTKFKSPIKLEL